MAAIDGPHRSIKRFAGRRLAELYALDPRHARMIWRSVEGERFVRGLQGENIPLLETQRNTYGQSKVLAPKYRPAPMATRVGRWLIERATARMRRDGYCAGRISIHFDLWNRRGHHWQQTLTPSQDTRDFLDIFDRLTAQFSQSRTQACSVGINLTNLVLLRERNGELCPAPRARTKQSERDPLCHHRPDQFEVWENRHHIPNPATWGVVLPCGGALYCPVVLHEATVNGGVGGRGARVLPKGVGACQGVRGASVHNYLWFFGEFVLFLCT